MTSPSPNGSNGGREENGRFAKGNRGGPGNPYAKRVAQLRTVLLDAVTEAELREIVGTLIRRAKAGNTQAAKLVLDRALGTVREGQDPDRVELAGEMLLDEWKRFERCRALSRLDLSLEGD